ncbi:glycosyltransferase [Mariprofundus sp. KV]|uniref:glycosyltransferase n=1 Tax=Mariprofundus sp. KV TaxID=2608715 RepID=UPI0015A3D003
MKKKIVISAINFSEGGPLTVLRDCTLAAAELLKNEWEIIVLVHKTSLIEIPGVTLIEFPLSRRSWFIRLYYEWFYFKKLSKEIKPDVWLSLHDITPRVIVPRQAVYCHNPAPFYQISLREAWLDPTFLLFNLFYRYLYGISIQHNRYVIVQQQWLRSEFKRLFDVKDVIVARPAIRLGKIQEQEANDNKDKYIFFYPTLPRVFKNVELVCESVQLLNQAGISNVEVRVTLDGSENRYAAYLVQRYACVEGVTFIGRKNAQEMAQQYSESDCVLFPSKLETWGLPISEAKAMNKPLLIADLPYAHETVGEYDMVSFVNVFDPVGLSEIMKSIVGGEWEFSHAGATTPEEPYARNWCELLSLLTASH